MLNTSANALTWVCWKVTLLGNSHCFGFWYSTQDIPRVLGQCWLPQSRRRQRSHTCFQALPWLQAGDSAASPRAVAATSLLNYINRPPSSVIFYFLGKKKWAPRVKNVYFVSVNTSKRGSHRSSQETFLWSMLESSLSG